MKLKGDITHVEEAERIIQKMPHCRCKEVSRKEYPMLLSEPAAVYSRIYVVDMNSKGLAVVRMWFDYRYRIGDVLIKDNRVWLLANAVPAIAKPFSNLAPFYTNKQERGDFEKITDKLFGYD